MLGLQFPHGRKSGCGCGCSGHGDCAAGPPQHATHLPAEDWWSSRSSPDAGSEQLSRVGRMLHASLTTDAASYANTGLQGHFRTFFAGDVPAQAAGVVHDNNHTVKSVPPNQTTLIAMRAPFGAD